MIKKQMALWLAGILTFCVTSALFAAEPPTASAGKSVPTQLEGKIVALDKNARLVTVDIKGTLIKIRMTVNVKLTKNGKSAVFENLAPGQSILVNFIETNGRIEVAALSVQNAPEPAQPAGGATQSGTQQPTQRAYFGNTPYGVPNPANISGAPASAYK